MVIDARQQLREQRDREIASLRAQIAAATDKAERRQLRGQIREVKRRVARLSRSTIW